MATTQSENLKLTLEDNGEFAGIEVTADNFQKIDNAFGELKEQAENASKVTRVKVTKSGDTVSADKTFDALKADFEKGNELVCDLYVSENADASGGVCVLGKKTESAFWFFSFIEKTLWLVKGAASGWTVSAFSPAASAHEHAQDDINGLATALSGKAASNHSHSTATQSAAGFLSASDKKKLDGVATGANKTTVDSTLSETSTNPVQTKAICTWVKEKINEVFYVDEGGTAS